MGISRRWWRRGAPALVLFGLLSCPVRPARAGVPIPQAQAAIEAMPPVSEVRVAARAYPAITAVTTNHAGWSEITGYVNVPQTIRVHWHVNSTGEAVLRARDAWDARAPWQDLGAWGRGNSHPSDRSKQGEIEIPIAHPTLLWLRVRAARFPHSGISRLLVTYERHTIAVLHGVPGITRRSVIVAEGYDPCNDQDWNDPSWQDDPAFARMVAAGKAKYNLDTWLLDWGDGGASLEQQADDFADLARQIQVWNGADSPGTVALGISMGAIAVQYALADAATRHENLGVCRYISLNGPHQGAWINPHLRHYLLGHVAAVPSPSALAQGEEPAIPDPIRQSLDCPAARELLYDGEDHDAFYARLHSLGTQGYDPAIPRVAFTNGALVKQGQDLAELERGKSKSLFRVQLRPLGLPIWITMARTDLEFRYDDYPGELLPPTLHPTSQGHVRIFSILRFDFRNRWDAVPTFVPTNSAADFPEDLGGGPSRFRYTRWRESVFPRLYVSQGRNLSHDESKAHWVDPRTGKSAPGGQSAVLYEILQGFAAEPGTAQGQANPNRR